MHEACAACALHHQEVENGGKCNAAQRAAQPPVNFLVAESKQQSKEVLQDKPRKNAMTTDARMPIIIASALPELTYRPRSVSG